MLFYSIAVFFSFLVFKYKMDLNGILTDLWVNYCCLLTLDV